MEQRVEELRQAIEQHRGGQIRWVCPTGLRSEVVALAQDRRRSGQALEEIADEIGVSSSALQRWVAADSDGKRQPSVRAARPERTVSGLRQVKIVDRSPAAAAPSHLIGRADRLSNAGVLTLVAPNGYRIEGLDVESAARLLEALR